MRYLTRKSNTWWVKWNVPLDVRHAFDDKTAVLIRGGPTITGAKRIRDGIVPKLQAKAHEARRGRRGEDWELAAKALELREQYESDLRELGEHGIAMAEFTTLDIIADIAQDIQTKALRGRPGDTINPEDEKKAEEFFELATGRTTYIRHVLDQYKAQNPVAKNSVRTRDRALTRLLEFRPDVAFDLSRRDASRFMDWLTETYPMSVRTANQHIWPLNGLWKWALRRGYTEDNPWRDQTLSTRHEIRQEKREFTDAEVQTLVHKSEGIVRDTFMILLLSGMRVHELAQLKVEDCDANWFAVKSSKTKAGERRIWIHSQLLPVLSWDGEYLLDCQGDVRKLQRHLDTFRKRHGLDIRPGGQRSSEVDNHSCRRWAVTQMLQAGQPLELVRAVIGHKSTDVTLRYLGGWSEDQLRDCIQSIKLPD